jgi:hypothetical protein
MLYNIQILTHFLRLFALNIYCKFNTVSILEKLVFILDRRGVSTLKSCSHFVVHKM